MEMCDQECCKVVGRFAFNVVAMFLAFLPFILLTGNGAQPFQRGFFCDDESIRYPFRPDTVTQASLYQGTLLISTAIILLVELFRYIHSKCTKSEPTPHSLTPSCSIPSIVSLLFRVLGSMYFGFAVTLSLIDVGKYSGGRLKPYFIAVCRPDPASYNCTPAGSGSSVYVENFRCLETNMASVVKARTSFPALHATLVSYFAAYLLIYLQVRITWKPVHLLKHVLQAACYAAAIYISISRVSDNAHSWSEVLVSFVAGNVIGILVVLFVCRILQLSSDSTQDKQLLQQGITFNEASVAVVSTQPTTPIETPSKSAAITNNFPVYNLNRNPVNGGGGNVYGFHSNGGGFYGNGGGFATAYSPAQQQLNGMRSSFVNYT